MHSHRRFPRLVATIIAGVTLAGAARAEPLTYAAALDLAERSAPSVQASQLKVDAAGATSRAAGRLPDPKLGAGVQNFPVSGPNAGRFNRDDFTMAGIGVMQDVPNAARRRADVAGATAEIGVAQAGAAETRRSVRAATALAWFDLAYAERRLAALDQLVGGLLSTGVTVSLPLFQGARQEPVIAARVADRNRVRIEREDRRRALVPKIMLFDEPTSALDPGDGEGGPRHHD